MNRNKQNKTKLFCLIFLMVTLLLPICQKVFGLFKTEPLVGYFEKAPKPVFTFENWFEGTYQAEKEKYIDQHYGFRDLLVRVNNQMDFWLYKKFHTENVLYGKDGMLYEKPYIESYLGKDFLGQDSVNRITEKLKIIQANLALRNKTLLIILAPGKATFFPELFPDRMKTRKSRNNHEEFSKQLREKEINTIDFNNWFLKNKNKTKYPLYTELGVHWTVYGASLALDSIIKFVEKKRGVDMPDYVITKYDTPDTLCAPDDDMYKALNVLFKMKHARAAYPSWEVRTGPEKVQVSVLTIADSYWWNIYNTGICKEVFKENRFWYYNDDAYPESSTVPTKVGQLDFNGVIDGTDVIILCYTECNLAKIGSDFIDHLGNYCSGTTVEPKIKAEKIKKFIDYIRADKAWMKGLDKRAKKEHKSLDSLIYNDAKWQVEGNHQ